MTYLLDGNVLVALMINTHVHHQRARSWFQGLRRNHFATCSVTQGTMIRVHMLIAADSSTAAAWSAVEALSNHPRHRFWDEGLSYLEVPHKNLLGPKQVTDAWLAQVARRRRGKLMTFDSALALLHTDVAKMIPQ